MLMAQAFIVIGIGVGREAGSIRAAANIIWEGRGGGREPVTMEYFASRCSAGTGFWFDLQT